MNSQTAVADGSRGESLGARAPYPKRPFSGRELLISLGTLLVIAIIVQSIYATVIRPRAQAALATASVVTEDGQADRSQLRSVWVIINDVESELSIILALWALTLIATQARQVSDNRKLLERTYVEVDENHVVLPEDARAYARPLERLSLQEQDMFLPRALMVGLNRFGSTRSVQDAAEAVIDECEFEASRFEAQLSMVKFTAWAVPAIGFVGTVRGIGYALQEAQSAVRGDVSGVTLGLGVAFNTTLTALVLSILVMFVLHQLQQAQDRLILDARNYVDRMLIRHMRVYK